MTKTVVMPKRARPPAPLGGKPVLRIGDDLRQMSFSMRVLSVLTALAVAGALGYLAYRLVR